MSNRIWPSPPADRSGQPAGRPAIWRWPSRRQIGRASAYKLDQKLAISGPDLPGLSGAPMGGLLTPNRPAGSRAKPAIMASPPALAHGARRARAAFLPAGRKPAGRGAARWEAPEASSRGGQGGDSERGRPLEGAIAAAWRLSSARPRLGSARLGSARLVWPGPAQQTVVANYDCDKPARRSPEGDGRACLRFLAPRQLTRSRRGRPETGIEWETDYTT